MLCHAGKHGVGKHYCRYGGLFIQVESRSAHAQERPASESRRQMRNTSNRGLRLLQESECYVTRQVVSTDARVGAEEIKKRRKGERLPGQLYQH